MGIHYEERTFALHGPSGLGAEPRPELVGPVLAGLHTTLVDSVRMGFLHTSRMPGKLPHGLEAAAAAVRFVGMDGSGDDLTRLHFRAARFGDVAAELFVQRQLWNDGPQPEQNAFDLLGLSLSDVRNQRQDSSRFDRGLLNRFAKYRTTLKRGVQSIRIEGATSEQVRIDSVLVAAAEQLRQRTPQWPGRGEAPPYRQARLLPRPPAWARFFDQPAITPEPGGLCSGQSAPR